MGIDFSPEPLWHTKAVQEGSHPLGGDIRHEVWIDELLWQWADDTTEVIGFIGLVRIHDDHEGESARIFSAQTKEELIEEMRKSSIYFLDRTLDHASEDCWCH